MGIPPSDPYESLEPGSQPEPARPLYPEGGTGRTLWRGLRKRCPRCGAGGQFLSWFNLRRECPRCAWRFEKEDGGFLGAMVLNYLVAIGLWLVVMVVGLVITVPDVPVGPLLVASVVVLVAVPLWFYPRSKTLWAAVEYLVLRSDPDYRAPTTRDPRARDLE
jgi:uncharacterized protein (DUF983 family)